MLDATVGIEQAAGPEQEIHAIAGDIATAVVEQAVGRGEYQAGGREAASDEATFPVVEVGGLDVQVTGEEFAAAIVDTPGVVAAGTQGKGAGRDDAGIGGEDVSGSGIKDDIASLGAAAGEVHAAATEGEATAGQILPDRAERAVGSDVQVAAGGEAAIAADAGPKQAGRGTREPTGGEVQRAVCTDEGAVGHLALDHDEGVAAGVKRAAVVEAAGAGVQIASREDEAAPVGEFATQVEPQGAA